MQYSQGLILKSRVEEIPLLFHFGVVLVEDGQVKVMHNTVDKNTVIESFEDYSEDRVVEEVFESDLMTYTTEELHHAFDRCKGDFDAVNYNCEHLIDCMLGHEQRSEQLRAIFLYTAVVALVYVVFFK